METKGKNKKDQSTVFSTHIGSVTGPVHTGSGDINIENISISTNISTKVEFLSYLKSVRSEIEMAQQEGLPEDTAKRASAELKDAEKEASKDKPNPRSLQIHLENAKRILLSVAGLATATKTIVDAVQSMVQHIDPAIQMISKLFN